MITLPNSLQSKPILAYAVTDSDGKDDNSISEAAHQRAVYEDHSEDSRHREDANGGEPAHANADADLMHSLKEDISEYSNYTPVDS